MPLSLTDSQACDRISACVYRFLPGSGGDGWTNHVTFATVAQRAGVGDLWRPGSKRSAVTSLLEQTLLQRPRCFQSLVVEIVRAGQQYCTRKGAPVCRPEIERLNAAILLLGRKFPELSSPTFLASLPAEVPSETPVAPQETGASAPQHPAIEEEATARERSARLAEHIRRRDALRARFLGLLIESDRQQAGYALEQLLTDLFALFGLQPHGPFRVLGEQIDGSFALDGEVYLLEAKWVKSLIALQDLLVFRGKIEAKSAWTRGVFLSVNGFQPEAVQALRSGRQANHFLMDGADLMVVLEGGVALDELLRAKQRRLAERGDAYVPVHGLVSA